MRFDWRAPFRWLVGTNDWRYARFEFRGWKDAGLGRRFHDSPGFYDEEIRSGRVAGICHPPGLIFVDDVWLVTPRGQAAAGNVELKALYDPAVISPAEIARYLEAVGLVVELA